MYIYVQKKKHSDSETPDSESDEENTARSMRCDFFPFYAKGGAFCFTY